MARKRNPARLVIALSVAAVLAVFLLYTSIAGGGTPSVQPSELSAEDGRVAVSGHVVGPVTGDAHGGGLFFRIRDVKGDSKRTVRVVYKGSVPDLFRADRDVHVQGELRNGLFVAVPGTLVTKCPSKYTATKST
ncbi:MAG: cytochrome c maturation protein CcmE [Gaiellaceae bacterium]